MHAGRRDVEPRVPDAAPRGAGGVFPALTETLGNPATAAIGPDEPSLTSLSTAPAVPPATVASYAVEGDQGVSRLEEIIRNRANRLETGKFSKYDSYYLPQSPLPFGVWEYKCRTCRFYNAREKVNARGATCNVVGQNGRLRDVIDAIESHFPEVEITYTDVENLDQLSYVVSDEKINSHGFESCYTLDQGVRELKDKFRALTV